MADPIVTNHLISSAYLVEQGYGTSTPSIGIIPSEYYGSGLATWTYPLELTNVLVTSLDQITVTGANKDGDFGWGGTWMVVYKYETDHLGNAVEGHWIFGSGNSSASSAAVIAFTLIGTTPSVVWKRMNATNGLTSVNGDGNYTTSAADLARVINELELTSTYSLTSQAWKQVSNYYGVNELAFTTTISLADLLAAGVLTQTQFDIALTQIKIHSDFTISDGTNSSVFVTESISPNNPLNTPNVFASTDVKTTTPQKWQDIEISSTGQYQIAVVGGYSLSTGHSATAVTGNVWISTDYGETWLEKTGIDQVSGAEQSWINACVSADGSVMMVKAMGNIVYRSENGGVSWTQKTITNFTERVSSGWDGRPYYNLLMASDGQRVIIGTYNNVQTKMMISTDGGTNWADLTSLSSEYEYIIDYHMSKSGKYILVMFNNSTRPKYSDDFGATFITITDTNLLLTTTTNYIMHLYSRGVCAISDNGYAIISDYNVQINTINLTTGTVSNNAYDGTWVTHTTTEFPWAVCISKNGKYMIVHLRQNGTYVNTMYISSDYGTTFTVADINEFYVGYKQVTFNSINLNSRCFATRFSDDNKYVAAIQEGDHIYVRKNTFIQGIYTPTTFAAKLTADLTGNTVTAGGDLTTITGDSTPYYRLYLQFANAATLTGIPKDIFNIPFSDFSVGAGGQVNLRNVNLDASMTIATSSNTSTIPAGNYFINNFVSTIETDLVDYTLLYDASNALITFDGLAQDISMSITSTDTTVFDTSITEITVAANTLPFITYGQPDPTLKNYGDNGITTGEFISNGYTIQQLFAAGVIPDWAFDTDANHFDQSYVKGFVDLSGSIVIRNDNKLITNGDLSLGGNLTVNSPGTTSFSNESMTLKSRLFMGEDISANSNVYVGGDLSVNGQFSGIFANGIIPSSAIIGGIIEISGNVVFAGDVSFNGPTVDVSNTLPVNQIEFNDATNLSTYDDNILSGTFAGADVIFKDSTFASVICEGTATATTVTQSSDHRIKENVTELNETDTVDALVPIQYNNTVSGNHEFGLLAHELQEVYPDLVVGDKDGAEYQQVHYNGLIGVLVKEIQELKQRLAVLNNR
jgi:hypothetical protein